MDRIEAEKRIGEHLIAIAEIYREHCEEGDYLSLVCFNKHEEDDGVITTKVSAVNDYFDGTVDKNIDCSFTKWVDVSEEVKAKKMDCEIKHMEELKKNAEENNGWVYSSKDTKRYVRDDD